MCKFKFSLRRVFFVLLSAALALGALAGANALYASIVWTATVTMLTVAVVALSCASGTSRAFWIGFAILGWAYLILVFAPWFSGHTANLLVTSRVLERLAGLFGYYKVVTGFESPDLWQNLWTRTDWDGISSSSRSTRRHMTCYWDFIVVGHSLFALAAGYCGGLIAYWFYATRQSNLDREPANKA